MVRKVVASQEEAITGRPQDYESIKNQTEQPLITEQLVITLNSTQILTSLVWDSISAYLYELSSSNVFMFGVACGVYG